MTLIVLALVGLMVLVVTVAPPRTRVRRAVRRPPRRRARWRDELSDPDAFDVSETLSAAPGAKPQTIEAELGDRVEIIVEGAGPDSVALGEPAMEDLEAGLPGALRAAGGHARQPTRSSSSTRSGGSGPWRSASERALGAQRLDELVRAHDVPRGATG